MDEEKRSQTSEKASPVDNIDVDEAVEASESTDLPDSGWWGSWITAAKSKSVEVLGMVKKDLDELSTAVKSEASHVINTTSSAIGKTFKLDEPESTANVMKKSFSTFLDQVNTVLNPSPDDDDAEAILIIDGDSVTLTNFQRDLLSLQKLDATYLIAPEGPALASMLAWLEATTRPSPTILEKHIRSSPVLQEKLERLVPHAVSRDDFWERYLFRRALLEDRLAQTNRNSPETCSDSIVNSIALSVEEKSPPASHESPSHSSVSSGDSARSNYGSSKSRSMDFEPSTTKDLDKIEDFASNIELTEEQQIKLLQEYENEIAANEKNKRLFEDSGSLDSPQDSAPTTPQIQSPASLKSNKSAPQIKATTKVDKTKKAIASTRSKSSDTISSAAQKSASKKTVTKKDAASKKLNEVTSNMKEDHFVADSKTVKKTKVKSLSEEIAENDPKIISDSASNNSDESWEKEFEIDDLHISSK
ncbi:uncharacterized protein LOC143909626 isoform X2 [Arctopsyche grandis]|uniref:uncharacterized protein LOC143909626 isoform X2 n=1 Tax=Arctopsyche grandis TaxID=121162 RepID=UPI00406D635C